MQLASHEVQELNELMMGSINLITNAGYFINHLQDQQLKSMMQKQYQAHVQGYNMMVEFLSQPNGSTETIQVPELNQMLQSFTQAPVAQFQPYSPKQNVQQLDDRDIATSYLFMLKRSGKEYASATMEMANPKLRAFFEETFILCSHHSYEVWQWMVQKGYYPLQTAPQPEMNTLSQLYQELPNQPKPITQQ